MNERPKLLFLCQTTPWPLDGGGWIRTYHVLRLLTGAFEVSALYFERTERSRGGSDCDADEARRALRQFGSAEILAVPQNHSRSRYVFDHLRSLLCRRVHTHYVYQSRAFRNRLDDLLASHHFDVVQINGLDLVNHLPEGVPVVCAHFDVESALWRRRASTERGRLRRWYFAQQAELMEAVEREWTPRFALNVTVSAADRSRLVELAPQAKTLVVPNGVDVTQFRPEAGSEHGIVWVGGTSWGPNHDALDFFCTEILPHLRNAGAEFPIRWVGSSAPKQQMRYRNRFEVDFTGYVEDVRPYLRDAFCQIVPLRAGGGTRLKILNAWAMGRPVVSTRVGCEGLEAKDGENALIRDDPKEFAEAILSLWRDAGLRRRLGACARETAERVYSWDVIGRDMIPAYLGVVQR